MCILLAPAVFSSFTSSTSPSWLRALFFTSVCCGCRPHRCYRCYTTQTTTILSSATADFSSAPTATRTYLYPREESLCLRRALHLRRRLRKRPRGSMPAFQIVPGTRVCIFFDCRVGGDGRGYEELRQTVYTQCSQMLTLSRLHSSGDRTALSASVHIVTHARVASHATSFQAEAPGESSDFRAADVVAGLRPLQTAQPDHSVGVCGADTFGNRMEAVMPHIQRALDDSQQRSQLILICSSYVSHTEATQSLSGLRLGASPHQWLRCILVDWAAVCVTVGELTSNTRVYRCSRSMRQLQAAVQDSLCVFLMPDVRPSRRLQLKLGAQAMPVIAALWHYGACLDESDTVRGVARAERASPAALSEVSDMTCRRLEAPDCCKSSAAAASVAEWGDRGDGCPTLHLRAILEADQVDESLLFGDTWVLALDTAVTASTLISSSAPLWPSAASTVALWYAFFNAFFGDALVLTGEATDMGSRHRALQRRHHFVAYFMPDKTMRVREIVPPELRFVPLPAPPTPEGLREQRVYESEMQRLRQQLLSCCASASFSLDALLSSG
ncbi:hypothetical protein LSCM1_06180 [Leishmania martiniquensis]|uniref:Uncharacterized protein n=1 Tax=Leishmania martiniquensis TaxID=1580590 RepID=A0A836KLI6_9TRYP|nr:hypothetical protein LSCM1_06180 [Leishmania martiniquensis]